MRFSLFPAALALSLLPAVAAAAPLVYSFNLTIDAVIDTNIASVPGSPLLGAPGTLVFTVDSDDIGPVGTTNLITADLTAFSFDILGQSFGIADLTGGFSGEPFSGFSATFGDGELRSVGAVVSEVPVFAGAITFDNPVPILAEGVLALAFSYNFTVHGDVLANGLPGIGEGQAFVPAAVPLPAGLPLMLTGLGALVLLRRRAV